MPDIIDNSPAGAIPAGTIVMFGGSTSPGGWLLCDGSAVSRTTYAGLFAVISTNFGAGNGTTTFNVPNFNNNFPQGTTAPPGATGGSSNALLAHTHDMANHHHKSPDLIGTFDTTSGGNVAAAFNPSNAGFINNGPSSHAVNTGAPDNNTTGNAGVGIDSRPPFLNVQFLIKT